jgi:hypothetical protein
MLRQLSVNSTAEENMKIIVYNYKTIRQKELP